ncbi:MAG: putative Kinase superfamily protein, partial [Streblomastix strix]
ENVIAVILKNVLQALEYIHNQGQIHRDIKASSILISAYGSVTLSDFGACSLLIENVQRNQHHHTFIGTPCWMAPEQIDTNLGYDSKIDIWAIGITAIELANGQAPHSELPQMNVLTQILKSPPPLLTDNEIDDDEDESDSDSDSESDSIIEEQLKLTIRKITTSIQIKDTSHSNKVNEQNNLIQSSIDEEDGLKHSSWIQISKEKQIPPEILSNSTPFSLEFKDFVNQCLQKDPQKRPSASKLLEHKFLKHTKSEDFIIKDILKWIISDHEITKLQHLTKHTYTRPLHVLHHSPIQDHTSESPKSLTNSTSNKEGLLSSHQNSAFESVIVSVDGAESQIDNISDVEQMKFKDSRNLWDFEMDNKIQKHIQEQ